MSEVATFNDLLLNMAEIDFFTTVLPFLLTYVVVFLALSKEDMPLFGKKEGEDPNKKFRSLVALIFGFFAAYYIGMNPMYQDFFSSFLARILIGIIGLIGLIVFINYIPGFKWENAEYKNALVAGIVIAVASAFIISDGVYAFIPGFELPALGMNVQELISTTFESGLIYLLVIGVALWWVTNGSGEGNGQEDNED